LRHIGSYSTKDEFLNGGFKEVLDDASVSDPASVKKVLFCSGKMYFDLEERKRKDARTDVALVRLEQIYPLPVQQLEALFRKYSRATWFWVQEEPLNMGAAGFLQLNLKTLPFGVISRQASASTATGYNKVHIQEQEEIIQTAFAI
jgi:2-oxoglutarate dehydrogenase E1 component